MKPQNVLEKLFDHVSSFITINKGEMELLTELTQVKLYKKGEYLLEAGKISKAFYFNATGIVRLFYGVNGEERTGFFYHENSFINPYASFRKQEPSNYYLKALKDTDVIVFRYEILEPLLTKIPKLERLARMIMEQELMVLQEVVEVMVTLSPEERFNRLMDRSPEIFQHVSQTQIASYLGVKPESLSRIKKRSLNKDKNLKSQ